ncbi:hypothetical protein E2C01_087953 [Portunus trituberculatus]|uniref:Uncharacterized protein n=1 Tax=Portunus trituberculatus TaxID=210409 RepID=A0A5B7J9H4_PORTR|nr:hypothetical protein [Portunus trituberculatus]
MVEVMVEQMVGVEVVVVTGDCCGGIDVRCDADIANGTGVWHYEVTGSSWC